MNIESYLFQSPYPGRVQFGRPDPAAGAEEERQEAVDALTEQGSSLQNAQQTEYMPQNSTFPSSAATARTQSDAGVSGALEQFTKVNTQLQAVAAYSA